MTSTIAAEVSPDWTGLDFNYDFDFGAPPTTDKPEHCASSGLEWEKRSKERLCSVSLRGKQRCLPQAIIREASIYGGILTLA